MERTLVSGVAGAPQCDVAEPAYGRECRPICSLGSKMADGKASYWARTVYQVCIVRVVEDDFGMIADWEQIKEYIIA